MSKCLLCEKNEAIKNSHYIPKFVFRWLKKTSVTGKIRYSDNMNLRVQDGPTAAILCHDCEELFSQYETYFSRKIFYPVIDRYTPIVEYDERLLKFAISVTWRAFLYVKDLVEWRYLNQKLASNTFEKKCREYLLREVDNIDFDHHLYMFHFVDGIEKFSTELVTDFNWYLSRSNDIGIYYDEQRMFLFCKIPWFLTMTSILPNRMDDSLINTKIEKTGKFDFNKQIMQKKLFDYYYRRARQFCENQIANLSDTQKQVIKEAYDKNIDKLDKSYLAQLVARELKYRDQE